MKRSALTLAILSSLILPPVFNPMPVQAANSTEFVRSMSGIQEYRLKNGLKVLLVENHAAPVATVLIVYRVGSRNEAVGYTGSTHFLEHMLFKGTPTFNKDKGSQIAQVLLEQGASFNATTWLDRTNYFETLPAEQLDLGLKIEADRMRNSFIADADRKSEMTVVRNELERGENNPDRIMWLNLLANAYMAHPYHHPTIGWPTDVEGVPTERLKKFYQDFYYPNNATLVVVGDLKSKDALKKIEHYFGSIKASPQDIPQVYTQEPPQQGERRFEIRRPGQLGIVNMAFHVPPLEHQDSAALDVLQGILSNGVSSRLHQALVEKNLALTASAWNAQLRDPGLFTFAAKLASDVPHTTVEATLLGEIEKLKQVQTGSVELQRVKNQILADFAFEHHGTSQLASTLGEYEAMADWRYMLSYPERIRAVTPEDVQRVTQKYFLAQNRTVGHFIPEQTQEINVLERNLEYETAQESNADSQKDAKELTSPVQHSDFAQNAHLMLQENHLDETVAIQGNIYAGSINDPAGKHGLASLTSAMLDRGTRKNNKLALAGKLESMGSEINFTTDQERTQIHGRALSAHLEDTLVLLSEMLQEPAFDADEFAKLKKQRMDALSQRLDNTDIQAKETLYGNLYPKEHPHALNTQTLLDEIKGLTLEDVKAFYKEHYGSNQMILTVVGDLDSNKVKQQVDRLLGQWPAQNSVAVNVSDIAAQAQGQQVIKTMKDKANVSIAMGVQTDLKINDADYFAAQLANHALGRSSLTSRLGMRVRDELGLTYGIYSYFPEVGLGSGPWLVGVTTNPDNVEKTIQETKGVIQKYLKEGISDNELKLAKSSMIGAYLVRLSTNPEIAERLTDARFYNLGDNYVTERAKKINMTTKAQVNDMIKKYFNPERLSIAIAGKYE